MEICLMYAQNTQRAIGYKGRHPLPWYFKKDLERFKKLTSGQALLMGRDTFLSMGRVPLRAHFVVTSDKAFSRKNPGIYSGSDPEQLIANAKAKGFKKLFIIGGSGLINELVDKVDVVYRTVIRNHPLEGDLAIVNELPENFVLTTVEEVEDNLIFQTFKKK